MTEAASSRTLELEAATRAAIAVAVPLTVLLIVGRIDLAVYASFGSFTALYGRSEPYRVRLVSVSTAAISLTATIALGVLLACLGTPLVPTATALVAVIAFGILAHASLGWIPGQPVFFVFALLVCAAVPTTWAEAPVAIGLAAASAALSWLLCMSGWMLRTLGGQRMAHRFRPLHRTPVRRLAAVRDAVVWRTIAATSGAALLAGAIALLLGIGRPYWAVVTVVAVMPLAHASFSFSRSLHRTLGTIGGVVVAGLVLAASPPAIVIVVFAVVCQFVIELLIGKSYGLALVFITPLALTMSNLSQPSEVLPLVTDRVVETAVGVAVAIMLVAARRWWVSRRAATP
ncbi:FUSC family protein [Salinibacterium hongtaonis]|uniref:FUSC family protein n=1 Tax=Homoserinimonas hongtaonis TaxID=2079791 RepID=UPI000D368A0C|nr:FUSC family protein [Salinibacterium hongtaonis]AWB89669.1 FUSC family protein [Salinibacterium hongtaonis]